MQSKALTLRSVQERLSAFVVPEFLAYEVSQFQREPHRILAEIEATFGGRPVIVRSSAAGEDSATSACAGEFLSVPNVASDQPASLRQALLDVIASYERKQEVAGEHWVMVQEMLRDTVMSGVVFTHDLNTGAPYYVINYDDISGRTDTVTGGDGEYANRTLYIHRGATALLRSARFGKLIPAIQELERILDSQFLDIEFALGSDLTPYLLQVRAITTRPNWNRAVSRRIDATLQSIYDFVGQRLKPMPHICGETTVLGQMPDWNPAEMIGRAPRALAFSLYKTLITNDAWRLARAEMGYHVPAGQPLMVNLAGQPFIDTRLSFHSFLPGELPSAIGCKLVDAWVARLQRYPELHDKVEFEVATTCFSFDIDSRLEVQVGRALSTGERRQFRDAVRRQTHRLVAGKAGGSMADALARIEQLSERQKSLGAIGPDAGLLFGLIEDCIRYGTIPFSILARHGFIARSFLLSLQARGALTIEQVRAFQSSIHTVASELVHDMEQVRLGTLAQHVFMEKYGHLRPGTYDILSRRYDQMDGFIFEQDRRSNRQSVPEAAIGAPELARIGQMLKEEQFDGIDADALLDYIRQATVAREYAKFVFTRSVSSILELLADYGERHGLSREEMSHIPVDAVLSAATSSGEGGVEERLRAIAQAEAERHALSVSIRLPQVLHDAAGVYVVPFQVSQPNFITQKKVTAELVHLQSDAGILELGGKVVLIENADPGFDWIFSQAIAGLVTKFGGANSHMAIRCAEFAIPAAIGCGEQRFEHLLTARQIALDCAAGLILVQH